MKRRSCHTDHTRTARNHTHVMCDTGEGVPLDEPVVDITALPLTFARSTLQAVGVFESLQAHFRQLDVEAAQQVLLALSPLLFRWTQ